MPVRTKTDTPEQTGTKPPDPEESTTKASDGDKPGVPDGKGSLDERLDRLEEMVTRLLAGPAKEGGDGAPKTRAERQANAEPKMAWSCLGSLAKCAPQFPEFAEFDKWHGCSSDGPLHYPGNAVFTAGLRDCWGRAAGKASAWEYGVRFNGVPLTHRVQASFWKFLKERVGTGEFTAVPIAHAARAGETFKFAPKWTPPGFAEKWHECPWDDKTEADEWCAALNACAVEFTKIPTAWSTGKARELDMARACAIWPEATDEELSVPPAELTATLHARLPGLLADFRRFIEGLGFVW